jgi:transcriptional regulator of heat shock response
MEYVIGTIVGGIIAGLAMILNSLFNSRITRDKEQREYKRKNIDKHISDLESIYEDALQSLGKLIRDKGRASEGELEKFYRLGIKLSLKSNTKIYNGFVELQNEIVKMAHNLPALPEEFIPSFEDDLERRTRLERRKKAEQKRDKEAQKYTDKLYQLRQALSDEMKNHLAEVKELLTLNQAD